MDLIGLWWGLEVSLFKHPDDDYTTSYNLADSGIQ